MLSVTDVYGLAKAHRASVLAAGAAVNRCLDIIAATRAAIAKAQREEPHPDLDAIAARVREAPDLYIPAEAREDIYRWPSLADSTSTPLVLLATPDQEAP
jgi:hypothetical protein